jgi:hypothetical protein
MQGGFPYFGVSDGGFSDNTGAYTISVTQLDKDGRPIPIPHNPEPNTLALLGLGTLPLFRTLRRWL